MTTTQKNQKYGIFDFDGTLCKKNAIHLLIVVKYHLLSLPRFILWFLWLLLFKSFFLAYAYKDNPFMFNRLLYREYKGFTQNELHKISKNAVFKFFRSNLFCESLLEINKLDSVFIVSASLDIFLHQFFNAIGIPDAQIFANKLAFDDSGICTGKLSGEIVDGAYKGEVVKLIQKKSPNNTLYVYGNSKYDFSMLKLAHYAYLINPDINLLNLAKQEAISITPLFWQENYFKYSNYLSVIVRFISRLFVYRVYKHNYKKSTKKNIIITNHQSYLDHFVIVSHFKEICFIGKKEHYSNPLTKWWHSNVARSIPIDRTSAFSSRNTLIIAKYAILLHLNIIIYPEGTRSTDGKVGQFKDGFLALAKMLKRCNITPCTINGAYQVLPKNKIIPNFFAHKITLKIHKPITLDKHFDKNIVLNYTHDIIEGELHE